MAATKQIRVAIAGGGMGGLCLAIGLMKYPHLDIQVYEAAHKFAEIGAGVAFGPNAQRAMQLIGPKVQEAFLRQATSNGWTSHSNSWFNFRYGMGPKEGELVCDPQNETGQCSVHRAHFLDEFVKLIPPEISHFGKRLVVVQEKGGESGVELHFADGTIATADCLIGADGVHSVTRKYLLGEDHPALNAQFAGSVAYRGLVPMSEATAKIGAEAAQNAVNWVGHGGVVMTYPIDFNQTMNVVAINSTYKSWDHKEWIIPADPKAVAEEFKDWGKTARDIVDLLDRPHLSAWSMWDHPPAPFYFKGRVCMMGDAAHATTPFQGQGAGQAIEDALTLDTLLGQIQSPSELPAAFAAYDKVRRPRTQQVVTTSRDAGLLCAWMYPGVQDDMEKFSRAVNTRMDWIWHKDLEAQNKEALELFYQGRKGEVLVV